MNFKQVFISILLIFSVKISAQQVNSLYFLENAPGRNYLNPSFIPLVGTYVELPVIGYTSFFGGNNSLSISDLIYKKGNNTVSFLHSDQSISDFFQLVMPTFSTSGKLRTKLVGLGLKKNNTLWSFSADLVTNIETEIPKDIFSILLYGTPKVYDNSFNLTNTRFDFTSYAELAIGYSKQFDTKWSVGGKVKLLLGMSNFSFNNSYLNLNAGSDKWQLVGQGSINMASPIVVNEKNQSLISSTVIPNNFVSWLHPNGYGAAIDFGVTYDLSSNIRVSGALVDLGFIGWSKNAYSITYDMNYSFDGLANITPNMSVSDIKDLYKKLSKGNALVDSLTSAIENSTNHSVSNSGFFGGINTKLNLGGEYFLWQRYLSLGLLSSTHFSKNLIQEELMMSLNLRPTDWLNSTLSYSTFYGDLNSLGAAVGAKIGDVHLFIAADYIPFSTTRINSIPFPYKTKNFNLAFGITLVLGDMEQYESSMNNLDSDNETESFAPKKATNRRKISHKKSENHISKDCHCEWE